MHGLASLVLEHLQSIGAPRHPLFEDMLVHSMNVAPPPFGENWFGRRYFELARNADWFANSLVANAALEGYGSRQLWAFSNKVKKEACAAAVRRHALDESRHSTMFVNMLRMVFPQVEIDPEAQEQIDALQPHFTSTNHPTTDKPPEAERYGDIAFLHEMVGIHFTEIRALVLQLLLRPALLAYSPTGNRDKLAAFSSVLIRDEARHIEYAANIIQQEAEHGYKDLLFALFEEQLREFNEVTMMELERDKVVA
jgi:rubrerythrin